MVDRAVDPLAFAIDRAATLYDLDSPEGSRQASERVLAVLARVPMRSRAGLDVKVAKAIDTLSQRIRVPVADAQPPAPRAARPGATAVPRVAVRAATTPRIPAPIAASALDPVDLELIKNSTERAIGRRPADHPGDGRLAPRRAAPRDPPGLLRPPRRGAGADASTSSRPGSTTRPCGTSPRALLGPLERAPIKSGFDVAPVEVRLAMALAALADRERQARIRDLQAALTEIDPSRRSPKSTGPCRVELDRSSITSVRTPSDYPRPDPRPLGDFWMDKLDEGLKTLLDLGKRRGFLTFDQVNDYLPDEASSPDKIHGLLESLDELGIELINEDEAEARLARLGRHRRRARGARRRAGRRRRRGADARGPRRDLPPDRRPGPDVPHPDGRDPAPDPRPGDRPRQEDRDHPQAVPPQGARMRLRAEARGRRPPQGQRRRAAVRPDGQGLGHREPREGPDPRPDAAEPGDARPPDGAEHPRLPQLPPRQGRQAGPPGPPPEPQGPPPQGGHAGRGALDPDPEGPAAHEAARAGLGPDDRAPQPARRRPRRPRRQGRPRQPARKSSRT